jgi:tetratricopeptide (TPR) repeat protein
MAVLHAALEDACAGYGRLCWLAGEPGIGKTRTVHELATYARQHGVQVLLGRCYEGEGAPPFWPWRQVIRTYIAHSDPETLRAEMGAGAAVIAQVMAEVRQSLPDLPTPPALEAAQERFRCFDSLTTFLKNAAQRQPLLLVFDDLQWADKPSLVLLQFLARELREACLYVVGTYRDFALDQHHPLTHTLGDLVREPGHQRLFLQGFSQDEVACFLAHTTGETPHEAVITALYRQTEGNPFFLTEIVRLLMTAGESVTGLTPHAIRCLGLPQGVREVIGRRLHTLTAPCYYLLKLASAIGRDFDLGTLAQVSGTAREQIVQTLESAVAARIITANPHAVGRYSFMHALIHDTLYADLPGAERVRLHRRIGAMLQERYGSPDVSAACLPPAHVLAALAHHFFEAARGGDPDEQAISYAIQAGQQATAMLAYEEAAAHYARALEIVALLHPTDARRQGALLIALGHTQAQAGEVPQARETWLQAAEIARRVGATELLTQAALGFEKMGIETGVVDQPLVTLLAEALNALGEQESALRARLLARLAQELHYAAGSSARRVMLSRQAVAMARQSGDPTALAAALDSRRLDLWGTEDVQERLVTITEIIHLAETVGNQERAMRSRIDRITTLLALGERTAADAELATYAQLEALQALLEGRFTDGEHLARQAFARGQCVQPHTATQFLGVQLLVSHWEQGRLQELEETVKSFVHQFPVMPWRSVLALIYCELGRQGEARQELNRMAAHNFADLVRDNSWLIALAVLSEVCYALEDTCRASTLYDLLLPYAQQNIVVGFATACLGSGSRYLGLLATTLTRWDEAEGHFRAALEMHARLGARPLLARTQSAYAAMLLTRHQPGDQEQARTLVEAALTTAQALGMQGIVEQVLALQHRLPPVLSPAPVPLAPCPPSTPEQDSQPATLFQQEGDYWTLSYQGVTCRLKDGKGLHYIADLLQAPGRTFHALELVTLRCAGRHGAADTKAVPDLAVTVPGDLGAVLDAHAKTAYKRRVCELEDELEETHQFHDLARATAIQAELDALTHELTLAFGLGGRDRKVGSTAERARSAVTKAIKAAVQKIQAHHPALGHHLATHLKTGTFCQYLPAPTQPVHWHQQ